MLFSNSSACLNSLMNEFQFNPAFFSDYTNLFMRTKPVFTEICFMFVVCVLFGFVKPFASSLVKNQRTKQI